jgi:hypothetical protein
MATLQLPMWFATERCAAAEAMPACGEPGATYAFSDVSSLTAFMASGNSFVCLNPNTDGRHAHTSDRPYPGLTPPGNTLFKRCGANNGLARLRHRADGPGRSLAVCLSTPSSAVRCSFRDQDCRFRCRHPVDACPPSRPGARRRRIIVIVYHSPGAT